MAENDFYLETIQQGYAFKGENVKIGCGMMNGKVIKRHK